MDDCKQAARIHVSKQQIKHLVTCMERFPSLAIPTSRTKEKKAFLDQKWSQISEDLNKIKWGCVKTGPEWQRYWSIYKHQVRKKHLRIKAGDQLNLNLVERQVIKMLCDDKGELLDPSQLIDPNAEFKPSTDDDLLQPLPSLDPLEEYSMDSDDDRHCSIGTYAENQVHKHADKGDPIGEGDLEEGTDNEEKGRVEKDLETEVTEEVYVEDKKDIEEEGLEERKKEKRYLENVVDKVEERLDEKFREDGDQEDSKDNAEEEEEDLEENDDEEDYDPPVPQPMLVLDAEQRDGENNYIQDNIWSNEKSKEEIQVDILRFHFKRQKETHILEMAQMRERHKLEMDILELKKKHAMHEYYTIRMIVNHTPAGVEPVEENNMSVTPMVTLKLDEGKVKRNTNYIQEQNIDTLSTKEELQLEILKFNLEKQKETHALSTAHARERHKLEMEILEFKKRKTTYEFEKIKACNKNTRK